MGTRIGRMGGREGEAVGGGGAERVRGEKERERKGGGGGCVYVCMCDVYLNHVNVTPRLHNGFHTKLETEIKRQF